MTFTPDEGTSCGRSRDSKLETQGPINVTNHMTLLTTSGDTEQGAGGKAEDFIF